MREMIRDSSERLFKAAGTLDGFGFGAPESWPGELWERLEDAGLPRSLADALGSDADLLIEDALVSVRVAAENAAPVPLGETMIAALLLARHGIEVPEGALSLAPVTRTDTLRWGRAGNDWRLEGRAGRVPWGRHVDAVVVFAPADGGADRIGVVGKAGWTCEHALNIAGEPRDTLTFDATVPASACPEAPEGTASEFRLAGAALRTIQIAGCASAVLAVTAKYATERVQFGRSIMQFQAVQQNLAVLASQAAAANAAADVAAAGIAGKLEVLPIAAAKARAGEAASIIAAQAHQIHGAMGFTAEYRLHRLTRRLWSWRDEFGSEAEWNRAVGERIAAGGADAIWPTLTAA